MPTKTETADELNLSSEEKYLHFKISNYLGSFSQLFAFIKITNNLFLFSF